MNFFLGVIILYNFLLTILCREKTPLRDLHRLMTENELQKLFAVNDVDKVPSYDVVFLRMRRGESGKGASSGNTTTAAPKLDDSQLLDYNFTVNSQSYSMNLRRNEHLISPFLRVIRTDRNGTKEHLEKPTRNCHYLGEGENVVAALNDCGTDGMRGLVILPQTAYSVQPLPERLQNVLGSGTSEDDKDSIPHVLAVRSELEGDDYGAWNDDFPLPSFGLKERLSDEGSFDASDEDGLEELGTEAQDDRKAAVDDKPQRNGVVKRASGKDKFLELAVFVDQAAYDAFVPYAGSENELREIILGYVNQIQALYYIPSLGEKLYISLVHLEIQKTQPSGLPHYDGDREKLLTSFCKYQAQNNPGADDNVNHWDMALYVSGLNFFAMENGKKNEVTMGLAPVGGVCSNNYACVIAELGVMNKMGQPYPSAGLMATYVAAHEMGHNLGMMHDGPPSNNCPSNNHVMSPSRGTKSETTWSTCSKDFMKTLDKPCLYDEPAKEEKPENHHKFKELPGQVWDAYDQCKVFLRDDQAVLYNETVTGKVCDQILCRVPRRLGFYSAGPALEGTFCDDGKWCQSGDCVAWGSGEKPPVVSGGWGEWKTGSCTSGCVENGVGVQTDTRQCDNPKPQNTKKVCEGEGIRVKLCDDQKLCSSKEASEKYATKRCKEFSALIPDITGVGVQVPHREDSPWKACAIFCKNKGGSWYTPVQEVDDRVLDPFFPDGTKCHSDGKRDYFCQQHVCQPSFKGRSIGGTQTSGSAVDIQNNARPGPDRDQFLQKLREYFIWDQTGKNSGAAPKIPDELSRHDDDKFKDNDIVKAGKL